MAGSNLSPLAHCLIDLVEDHPGRHRLEPERGSDAEHIVERRLGVSADSRAEVLGPGVWVRVEVECGRQHPGIAASVQKPVVAEMIVRVGDEHEKAIRLQSWASSSVLFNERVSMTSAISR
jgi:hypothetical protein